MKNLSILELSILETIIEENKKSHSFLINRFENIIVINRKYSGVGIIVNLGYM